MAFVRVKRIYGGEYAYLVENSWTNRGARQKVSRYLGKVHRPEKAKSESLAGFLEVDAGRHVRSNHFRKIASDLVKLELHNHDVKSEEINVDFEDFTVKHSSGKSVVVAMNDGFLCGETLKRLAAYEPEKDYSGFVLADLLTAAGIKPDKDAFIELYGKFRQHYEANAAKEREFYY